MTRHFEKITKEQYLKENMSQDVYEKIKLPKRATGFSAGYDIFSPTDFILYSKMEIIIPTGIKVCLPENEFLMIVPRSGLGFKYYTRLANTVGIIDSDYYNNTKNEGHIMIKLRNESDTKEMQIKQGDAIAQAIFMEFKITDDDELGIGNKREGGIGSTNLK
jgi:dUTP pyrophosphatase